VILIILLVSVYYQKIHKNNLTQLNTMNDKAGINCIRRIKYKWLSWALLWQSYVILWKD